MQAEETPPKKITVYVREPDHDTYTLSFPRHAEIAEDWPPEEAWAVDGDSVVVTVKGHWDEVNEREVSREEALVCMEEILRILLGSLERSCCEAEFVRGENPPKKITVYVRAPNEGTRTLSFHRIPEMSDKEALSEGMAIDGNSFVIGLTASDIRAFDDEAEPSLEKALHLWQAWLVEFLEKKGCEVEFN